MDIRSCDDFFDSTSICDNCGEEDVNVNFSQIMSMNLCVDCKEDLENQWGDV